MAKSAHTSRSIFAAAEVSAKAAEIASSTKRGLIKRSGKSNIVLFSKGKKCGSWTEIPAADVLDVAYIEHVNCDGHNHPYVELVLR